MGTPWARSAPEHDVEHETAGLSAAPPWLTRHSQNLAKLNVSAHRLFELKAAKLGQEETIRNSFKNMSNIAYFRKIINYIG